MRQDFRLAPVFALVAALFALPGQANEPTPSTTAPLASAAQPTATPVQAEAKPMLPLAGDTSTPTADEDLWSRVRRGFKIDAPETALVQQHERFYASNPEFMKRVVERSRRYMYFIVSEVERRGMPTEIALLPIVESAFVPKAQSPASASGLWQFIPSTGQRYGLERTWWYDGRHDVMAATYAALDYLQDLYNLFGDWQLALAAYNWGEGGVGRALAKTRAKGLDDDFLNIRKPRETENYVPKLIAVRNIIANPDAFGVKIPSLPNQPYFEPVSVGRHMDLQVAARLAEVTVDELLALNPGFSRPVIAFKEDRKLLLPVDKVATFERNLSTYDKPLLSWQPYVTKPGESLKDVADRFGMSLDELRDLNKLQGQARARGQTILVAIKPDTDTTDRTNLASLMTRAAQAITGGAEREEAPPARTSRARTREHVVARGETLFTIAQRYGMRAEDLRVLNGLKGSHIARGQTLKVAAGEDSKPPQSAKDSQGRASSSKSRVRHYTVKHGDTLEEIADRYDVTVAELRKWNKPATRGVLRVGLKLEIRQNG